VRQLHKLAARVPAQSPLAAPWGVAAPVADRDGIYTVERLDADAAWPAVTCDRLAAVLLPARAWSTVGARLTTDGGYHLAGYVDRAAALLQCEPAPLPWPHLETTEGQPRCAAPEVRWPTANLEACDLALLGDGRVAMRLQAIAPDGGPETLPTLRAGDLTAGRGPAFRFLRGLVDASQLAGGATVVSFAVVTSSPAPPEWGVFVAFEHRLVDAELPSEYGWERGETFVPAERFSLR
jgi:hypothetical protein